MGRSCASINQAVAAVRDDGGVRREEAGPPHLEPHHSTDDLVVRGGSWRWRRTRCPVGQGGGEVALWFI